MRRAKWKGNFLDNSIYKLKNIKPKLPHEQPTRPKIWSRRSVIPGYLINKNVSIYNGKEFKKVKITREKVGYKFGEFCTTRKYQFKR